MMQVGVVNQGVSEMLATQSCLRSVNVAQCQVTIFQKSSCRPSWGRVQLQVISENIFWGPRVNFLPLSQKSPWMDINTKEWFETLCFFHGTVLFYMFFFVAWCVCRGGGCHSNGNSSKCNWLPAACHCDVQIFATWHLWTWIAGLHSHSAWLSGDAAMRSTQQPRAQIKTQFVELLL